MERAVPRDLYPLPPFDLARRDGKHVSYDSICRGVAGAGRRSQQASSRKGAALRQADEIRRSLNWLHGGDLSGAPGIHCSAAQAAALDDIISVASRDRPPTLTESLSLQAVFTVLLGTRLEYSGPPLALASFSDCVVSLPAVGGTIELPSVLPESAREMLIKGSLSHQSTPEASGQGSFERCIFIRIFWAGK